MVNVWFFDRTNARNFACQTPDLAHLDSTTIWRLESRQNPHAGKRALRSAAFPGCGFAELPSSATCACSRRTLVGVSRGARVDPAGQLGLDKSTPLRHIFCRHVSDDDRQRRSSIVAD